MKPNHLLATLTAVLMVAAVPNFSMSAQIATSPMAAEVVSGCAAVETTRRVSPACGAALEKGLNSSRSNVMKLQGLAKASDPAAAKKLLMEYGLTEQQLEGAAIIVKDETGGRAAASARITITITCCPLTITIIVRL